MAAARRLDLISAALVIACATAPVQARAGSASPPHMDAAHRTALGLIGLEGCRIDWNGRVTEVRSGYSPSLDAEINSTSQQNVTDNGKSAISYGYSSKLLPDFNVCGSYSIPDISIYEQPGINRFLQNLIIQKNHTKFIDAAVEIFRVESDVKADRAAAAKVVSDTMDGFARDEAAASQLLPQSKEGSLLPIVHPAGNHINKNDRPNGLYAFYCRMMGSDTEEAWSFRDIIGGDLDSFDRTTQQMGFATEQ